MDLQLNFLFFKCVDEEDDGDDNNSFNGGYGKSSMSPYDDDDIGKNWISIFSENKEES